MKVPPVAMHVGGTRSIDCRNRHKSFLRHINCISAFEVDLVQGAILEMQLAAGNENAPLVVSLFDPSHNRDRG
jgi:hypothetical protein